MVYVSLLDLVNHLAVFLGLMGTVLMLFGIVSFLAKGPSDPQILNPKSGIASNINFIYGGVLILLCWAIKLVVVLIDPSMPVFGPAFMWYRISREKGFYDDTFFEP